MIEENLREAISRLAGRIRLKVNSIVLFGSHARMEELEWSDVDLLIISEDFSKMRVEDRVRIILEEWDYWKPVEPVCLSPEEASEKSPLIWEVCRDGVVILDDGTFDAVKARCLKHLDENKIKRVEHGYIWQG